MAKQPKRIQAFAGDRHVRLVVLFPEAGTGEAQRRFITTAGYGSCCARIASRAARTEASSGSSSADSRYIGA